MTEPKKIQSSCLIVIPDQQCNYNGWLQLVISVQDLVTYNGVDGCGNVAGLWSSVVGFAMLVLQLEEELHPSRQLNGAADLHGPSTISA